MPIYLRSIISGRARIARWTLIVGVLTVVSFISLRPSAKSSSSSPPHHKDSPMMAAAASLKHITVPPVAKHTATVIFVHGLGDTGHGWKPVADMFRVDPALAHVKWILPHSPIRTVKANMGIEMPSWFDIYSFGFDTDEDEMGMLQSARQINQLITAEVDAGTDPSRIVLGGFSQGGAMSLLTGLTGERKLAGIAVLSGWLPLKHKFKAMASPKAAEVPLFWGHGAVDPLVKREFSKSSVEFLNQSLGMPLAASRKEGKGISYNIYDGIGHTTNPRELEELKEFITTVIPGETPRPSI
ncbi:Phospholipase/Carboxylesterase-domain-containing protein [Crucibulum laeve]|uniref:Acyl-protein thioesterase 1 n=1 Tax=Crucibulum laeve TaxID=68775 RepID=A0A5C3MF31_9AGAR|nr:Phospholipase/Carboxylesterase-domain-containing protein [Crucibulum laeve]